VSDYCPAQNDVCYTKDPLRCSVMSSAVSNLNLDDFWQPRHCYELSSSGRRAFLRGGAICDVAAGRDMVGAKSPGSPSVVTKRLSIIQTVKKMQ